MMMATAIISKEIPIPITTMTRVNTTTTAMMPMAAAAEEEEEEEEATPARRRATMTSRKFVASDHPSPK